MKNIDKIKLKENCKICNEETENFFYINNFYKIIVCRKCGFIFKPDVKIDYQSLNESDFLFYNYNRKKEVNELNKIIKKFILKPRSTIIEIGVGTGSLLNEIKKLGYSVSGFEPSYVAFKIAKNLFNLNGIKNAYFHSTTIKNIKADIFLLYDVLEHLNDPKELFSDLSKVMTKDDILIVKSGNPNSINAKIFPPKWIYYNIHQHVSFFNKKSLSILSEKNGLKLINYFKFIHPYGGKHFYLLFKNIIKGILFRTRFIKKKTQSLILIWLMIISLQLLKNVMHKPKPLLRRDN